MNGNLFLSLLSFLLLASLLISASSAQPSPPPPAPAPVPIPVPDVPPFYATLSTFRKDSQVFLVTVTKDGTVTTMANLTAFGQPLPQASAWLPSKNALAYTSFTLQAKGKIFFNAVSMGDYNKGPFALPDDTSLVAGMQYDRQTDELYTAVGMMTMKLASIHVHNGTLYHPVRLPDGMISTGNTAFDTKKGIMYCIQINSIFGLSLIRVDLRLRRPLGMVGLWKITSAPDMLLFDSETSKLYVIYGDNKGNTQIATLDPLTGEYGRPLATFAAVRSTVSYGASATLSSQTIYASLPNFFNRTAAPTWATLDLKTGKTTSKVMDTLAGGWFLTNLVATQ